MVRNHQIFAKEAILWGQLHHPNILPFYGIYYLDENRKQICLVSPWMTNGNLSMFLKKNPLAARKPFVSAHPLPQPSHLINVARSTTLSRALSTCTERMSFMVI